MGIGSAFCRKYKIDRLVYYEEHQYILNAIDRETEIKKWRRAKKVALIENMNPTWRDLRKDFELSIFRKQPTQVLK